MGAKITVQLQFWQAGGEEIAAITLVDTTFEFTALVNDMALGMQLHKVNVDKITADLCTCGKLKPTQLKIELNNAFRFGMPIINKLLAAHVI